MENNIIRVTKAQKLTAIKGMIPEDVSVTFKGDGEKGKQDYLFNYAEVIAFLDKELELLSKKNSGDKKLTAAQKENEKFKEDIVDFLTTLPADSKGATCTEMFKKIPTLNEYSPQKVAALCRQLKEEGKVVSHDEKGKALFALA